MRVALLAVITWAAALAAAAAEPGPDLLRRVVPGADRFAAVAGPPPYWRAFRGEEPSGARPVDPRRHRLGRLLRQAARHPGRPRSRGHDHRRGRAGAARADHGDRRHRRRHRPLRGRARRTLDPGADHRGAPRRGAGRGRRRRRGHGLLRGDRRRRRHGRPRGRPRRRRAARRGRRPRPLRARDLGRAPGGRLPDDAAHHRCRGGRSARGRGRRADGGGGTRRHLRRALRRSGFGCAHRPQSPGRPPVRRDRRPIAAGRPPPVRGRARPLLVPRHGLAARGNLRPHPARPGRPHLASRRRGPCARRRARGRGRARAARGLPVRHAGRQRLSRRPAVAPAAADPRAHAGRRRGRDRRGDPLCHPAELPGGGRAAGPLVGAQLARALGRHRRAARRPPRPDRDLLRPGLARGPAEAPAARAPGLSHLHPGLARLVRVGPALGRQRAHLHRCPAQRLPLGGLPARAPDLHPLGGGRRCPGLVGTRAVLRMVVPVRRAAGTPEPRRAATGRPAADLALVAARAPAQPEVPGLPRLVRGLAGLDRARPPACRGRAVQDRDRPALLARALVRGMGAPAPRHGAVRRARLLPLPLPARRCPRPAGAPAPVRVAEAAPAVRRRMPDLRSSNARSAPSSRRGRFTPASASTACTARPITATTGSARR